MFVTLVGQTIQFDCEEWKFQSKRKSELLKRAQQAPLTPNNLVSVICSNHADFDTKVRAAVLLYEAMHSMDPILEALRYKTQTEKINGSLQCSVIEKTFSLDPLQAAFGVGDITLPLDWMHDYINGYKLFSQQLIGANLILQKKRCSILYDMRVGKTLTSILAAKILLSRGVIDHIIVVSPKPIMQSVWESELNYQDISTYCMVNGYAADFDTVAHIDCDAYLVSFESLGSRLDIFQCHMDMERVMVIADETAWIKNPTAKRTKSLINLTFWPEYVVFLTGAPMEQGPADIWSQMFCIDRGESFGATVTEFVNRFLTLTYQGKYVVNSHKRMIFELALQAKSLRYVRSEADQFAGKDKNFRYIKIAPSVEQKEATDDAINGLVRMYEDDPGETIKTHILVIYGYLREICCGYNKIQLELEKEGPYSRFRFEYDPKTLWLKAFLLSNPGVPVVVFSEFDEHEAIVANMLREEGISFAWMKRDPDAPTKFNEGDVRVILMKSAQGYGLTLNRVNAVESGIGTFPVIIYMAPTWRLGAFLQSQDRCVGTYKDKNICTPIYALSIAGSIEEKIITSLRRKKEVAETLLKDTEREGFESFVDSLRLDTSKANDADFDAEEMHARALLGISPEKKCTHKLVIKALGHTPKVGIANVKDRAGLYLLRKYSEDGTPVFSHSRKTADEEFGETG